MVVRTLKLDIVTTCCYHSNLVCINNHINIFSLDHNGQLQQLVLVQYFFTGQEHDIHVQPHGNSKGSTPYKRTRKSTMKCIKELSKQLGPRQAANKVREEVGGMMLQEDNSRYLMYEDISSLVHKVTTLLNLSC